MSKIKEIINPEGYEYVRDRLAEILIEELDHQRYLTSDPDLKVNVFVERTIAIDKTELPCINIQLANGLFSKQHQGQTQGGYLFYIDCHASGKSTTFKLGDTTASIRAQRLGGIVRRIIEDPVYKTLGFKPPYISRLYFEKFDIGQPVKDDAAHSTIFRQFLQVSMPENVKLIVPELIDGYDTRVKINSTNRGYSYTTNE